LVKIGYVRGLANGPAQKNYNFMIKCYLAVKILVKIYLEILLKFQHVLFQIKFVQCLQSLRID